MLVPSDNEDILQSTGTAASSPFVVAFTSVGIKTLPSVINAGVLTSAFSAANSSMYSSSRLLYGLALRGQAPRIFAKTLKGGLPIVSLCVSGACVPSPPPPGACVAKPLLTTSRPALSPRSFSLLAYMTLSDGASTALNWLSNLTSIAAFIGWGTICVAFLRFKAACEAQGIDRSASK